MKKSSKDNKNSRGQKKIIKNAYGYDGEPYVVRKEELKIKYDFDEIYKKVKKRRKKNYLLRIAVFLLVLAGIYFTLNTPYFNIKSVEAEGGKYYTDKEIVTLANVKVGNNIIFHLDKGKILDRLTKNPYFEEVEISRSLPNTVKIKVKERMQLASLAYGDKYIVIDDKGLVLRKTEVDPKLPLITGLKIKAMDQGKIAEVSKERELEEAIEILRIAKKNNIFFKKISIGQAVTKAYIFDEFLIKASEDRIISNIKKGNIQKVIADLLSKDIKRGTITIGGDGYISFSPDINS